MVKQWKSEHPGEDIPDGHIFTQPWPAGPRRQAAADQVIYYQYKADRARRTLRGIDEQVAKAEKAVAGQGSDEAEPVHPARPAPPTASTGNWKPRPATWPG